MRKTAQLRVWILKSLSRMVTLYYALLSYYTHSKDRYYAHQCVTMITTRFDRKCGENTMADTPEKIRRGVGRVAFLARLDEFRKLVNAGWPITIIYEDHGSSTGLSYSQFVRYVGKYLRTPPTRNVADEQPHVQALRKTSPEIISKPHATPLKQLADPKPSKPVNSSKGRIAFRHDPSSGNTRDDLI